MLKIKENFDLKNNTTWHITTVARAYVEISSFDDLNEFVKSEILLKYKKFHVLGGGANTLFADSKYDGLVISVNIKGKEKISQTETHESWKIMSGEDWIELVEYFVANDLGGVENLAYIPGKVGAAPVQNIAAYGKAFEEVCEKVETFDLLNGQINILPAYECGFAYRTSKFKNMLKDKEKPFVITSVVMRLTKPGHHKMETSYFSMSEKMTDVMSKSSDKKGIQLAFDSIVAIRKSKLPDHNMIGTNGSLFVNPIVNRKKLKELLMRFPKLQFYPTEKMQYLKSENTRESISETSNYKIAAGHIFDTLGWKGKRVGNVGTWEKHALVLCSFGAKEPQEVLSVIKMMQQDFAGATGIMLEPEINIIY